MKGPVRLTLLDVPSVFLSNGGEARFPDRDRDIHAREVLPGHTFAEVHDT